jgi:hypothetical protein
LLAAALLGAGCDPCSGETIIRGRAGGESVTWCGAHYGITLDLGSHYEQQTNAPVRHSLTLMLTRGEEPCEVLSDEDIPPGAILALFAVPEAPGELVDRGFAVDLAKERTVDVEMNFAFSSTIAGNLPQRGQSPPYREVSGELDSSVHLSLATDPPYPSKSERVGEANGRFRAHHCGNLDLLMLE